MKKLGIFILSLICLISIAGCSSKDDLAAVDPNDPTEFIYELKSGSNITTVAEELEELGYIRKAKSFKKYAKENELINIKAGDYLVSKSMSSIDILNKFVNGDNYKGVKLLVPEGYEAVQIAAKLEESGLCSKEDFMNVVNNPQLFKDKYDFINGDELKTLEGYLFPRTYFFKQGETPEEIADEMLNQFNIVYQANIKPNMENTKLTLNEVVILASVVEREAAIEDEMPLVASVFLNRLDIAMPLQSCATVQYILGERKPILSTEDTKIDSPYNTYQNAGLPVAPIASPGEKAIMAVLQPAETKYLYFLAKNDGSKEQVYSETYEEHLKNKEKYLR